ncbi:TonB-dependent receptor [Pseudoduganella sp. DS3]|uniref:TonB-dependent receptor n=1 Tax=Pseudoduganella guangdongensis TaxID=2692179 RepID=A0A6N9HQ06_9BURK|nr:TonB-dependent receptor [Pseudoduganella guangdongensis]MYN04745.1 TonB-dependent receptor [Pseudoduganella guangdongensis]
MKKIALPLLLIVQALNTAYAQEPAAPAPEKVMPKVEVKGSAAMDIRRNDTATKIVVTQEEILKNGDTSIGEVLKRLPGVTVDGVQGRGGAIRMRGLGAGYTSIMLNGEPAPPGFSLDSLTPDMIERVEVMRAATAEFSTQAIAGAINIVLKRAITTAQTEIKTGLQTDNGKPGVSVNLQMSDRKGPWSYSIGGGFLHNDFDRTARSITEASGTEALLHRGENGSRGWFRNFNIAPRVNYAIKPGDVITSQTFIAVNRFRGTNTERIQTIAGLDPMFSSLDQDIRSQAEMFRTDLSWAHPLADGAKLDLKLGANYNQRSSEVPNRQSGKEWERSRRVDSSASDKGFTTTGKYSSPLIPGHALATGWDIGYSKRDEDRIQRETYFRAPPLPGPDGTPVPADLSKLPKNLDEVFAADVTRVAAYVQDEWNVSERWSVYFGLRWEGVNIKSSGSDFGSVDSNSSVLSPLFQTLYKLGEKKKDQVRLGLTRTYKAPNVGDLIPRRFTANNNTATTPDFMGNPDLKPELAWGLDLAYEHFLGEGGGLLTASTYARRIDDVTRRRVDLIDGAYVSRPVNAGNADTYGIELEAKLPLRSLMKDAPGVEMRANLTRSWSKLDTVPGPNNRLDQQVPISGTVGADWKLDSMPLTVGGSYSYQGGGEVRISDKQYAYSVPKRALDMYGLWKFTPKTQLRVSASNMLHQDNLSQSTYVEGLNRRSDTSINPTSVVFRAMLEMKL